jgi:hypothetical protein
VSNAYTAVRERIKAALATAGLHAFEIVPENLTPPAVWVAPADPYITREGAVFGGEIVHHEVVVVTGAGVNAVQADALGGLIIATVDALDTDPDLVVGDVGRPGQIAINGQKFLACAIAVDIEIHR